MLEAALSADHTPFQYIIVGSGAGGGPLAARLAKAGRRVLLLEAGTDQAIASDPPASAADPPEVQQVPGYHAAATEHPEISWGFSVRHYADADQQKKDSKYRSQHDPSQSGGKGKGEGGIFYPRCSALGGCTAHHAMIIVAPNDRDWDEIADLTGDDSWRGEHMRGYFTRLEKNLYFQVYRNFFHKIIGFLYFWALQIISWINPRAVWNPGYHGYKGWQPTSFIDPNLVAKIGEGDTTFRDVLVGAVESVLGKKGILAALRRVLKLQLVLSLDPNDPNNRRNKPEELAFIPVGTDGVSRVGVRELLLETQKAYPDNLIIVTGVHATKILFGKEKNGDPPCARGVEVVEGHHLYQASPLYSGQAPGSAAVRRYFAKNEVIICGGSFNTPQLLMLSGIGNEQHLKEHQIEKLAGIDGKPAYPLINLPGVGLNLQDRYEVSVISQLNQDFVTLKGVSFVPGDPNDPSRDEWFKSHTGLYTTNGGTVAVLKCSGVDVERPEPDLFIFGAPVSFPGYYWGWSKDLLREKPDETREQRNLWSWVILKAYTRNNRGRVRLLSNSPFATPEICFASFAEGPPDWERDRAALVNAVQFVRQINASSKLLFKNEIQPGANRRDDSPELDEWIQNEAWGHHACGTCRIGPDPWQADVRKLNDKDAVLDSKFKVHGVRNLRVVDASVFPKIPGYFIVTPVFMISEKAADTILADTETYPESLSTLENAAVHARRNIAFAPFCGMATDGDQQPQANSLPPPPNPVGLALSGGGIRSATFCLGVLQALARKDRLREVDFLSTVSGGGYIGGFLGRFFTRIVQEVPDKVGRVQEKVADLNSPEIEWLRSTGNYLAGGGLSDLRRNLAIFWRNLFAVHLVIAALVIAIFGVLTWVGDHWIQLPALPSPAVLSLPLSPWWVLGLAVLVLAVLPGSLGFWLAPRPGVTFPYPPHSLLAWIVLLIGSTLVLALPGGLLWGAALIGILILSYLWQEIARWILPKEIEPARQSSVIRSELTIALGEVIFIFAGVIYYIALDTLARSAAANGLSGPVTAIMLALAPVLPLLKVVASRLGRAYDATKGKLGIPLDLTAASIAFPLVTFLLLVADVLAQEAFRLGSTPGLLLVFILFVFSCLIGRALTFLNLSSLQAPYAARLTRTFLGASNTGRLFGTATLEPTNVLVSHPGDDIPFGQYHPEKNGGPLHLINVCVNQTAEFGVERDIRERKGVSMALGPEGVSVGPQFHAIWTGDQKDPVLQAIPTQDPNGFHVLADKDGKPVHVEQLRLGQWIGISGAAIGTGEGYSTSLPMSLLFGLANIRLGYWWNSGLTATQRPGCRPPSLWQRIKSVPAGLFPAQSMILSEFRSYFRGPAERYWYLSDGGHFEDTGIYELVRRRLSFIIMLDAAEDPDYHYNDLARCTRLIRLDFGADLEWLDPTGPRKFGANGWDAFGDSIPNWIKAWLDADMIGRRDTISRSGLCHSALGEIRYDGADKPGTWVLLIKASLTGDESVDVLQYSTQDTYFPNSPTTNQFYGDAEWESYRDLGDHIGTKLFTNRLAEPSPTPPTPNPEQSTANAHELTRRF
jgi:choline dehydrogenase-like flavoprotein